MRDLRTLFDSWGDSRWNKRSVLLATPSRLILERSTSCTKQLLYQMANNEVQSSTMLEFHGFA